MKKLFINIVFLLMSIQPLCASATSSTGAKGLSAFGELLYWNASEQTDSVWANDIGFPSTNHVTYSTPNVRFNWSRGFRGGVAYEVPHFWNLKLSWTHLPTRKSINYVAGDNHIITPEFFSGFLSGDSFSSASLDWQIAMNTIDFGISHNFNAANSLVISPSIGVKEATINQAINLGLNATLFTVPIFSSTEVVKNNFAGIGPTFGIDGKWNFYKDFSVVGNFSTALMWGHWNVNDTYSRPSALAGLVKAATINTKMTNAKLGTPMFQYFLGFQWAYESTYQVKFLLGYEMQYWANQLRAPTFQLLPLHGDLTLQGGTCGISISL
ncbi:MAG: Lpg1974 family pore-forming outer membrane protein [Gammaproteobacteria bacterium]|nr:Lpg1974 family pore-forming outer membrane protein [Gammaproteobacteria bacterium]